MCIQLTILNQEEKQKLNEIKLIGCEHVLIGDVLHYSGIGQIVPLKILKCMLGIIRKILVKKFTCFTSENPNTLCLFSSFVKGRKDHEKAFKDVADLVDNKIVVFPQKFKPTFHHLKYTRFLIDWNQKLKRIDIDLINRLWYINFIFDAFLIYKDYELEQEKNKWEIKNLITFCDVHPTDCFFVQKFNNANKTTITLQHGGVAISYDAWAYSGSKSDVFLADSPHTIENAKTVGYRGKIIPVGSMHCINDKSVQKPLFFKDDIIGIIMNSPMMPVEDNITMLETVQEYCKKYNKKVYIKYHPLNNRADYTHFVDSTVSTECEESTTIKMFFEMIDIAVVCDSTVFTTALFNWIPSLLFFREGFDQEKYLHTEDIKFKDSEQLRLLIDKIPTKEFEVLMENYRKYFLSPGEVKENYKKALNEIGINNVK